MCDDALDQSVYRSETRASRKDRPCCECGRTIAKGEKYEYAAGLYDGEWQDYHTCLDCESLKERLDESCHLALDTCIDNLDWIEDPDTAYAVAEYDRRTGGGSRP